MGMPEESEPTEYRKGVIMKKHRIISIALSVIGIAATVSLAVYLLKDRIKGCPFCGNNSSDEPEEDIFDSDLDDLEEFVPVEKDKCVKCGICANVCPVGDIKGGHGEYPEWLHHKDCLTCFTCYHHCPHHAIEFGKQTQKKGQYYF